MKCPNCGSEVDDNTNFCNSCGSKIKGKATGANVKIPWFFQMWFITVVFWVGSIFFGIGTIVGTVLFVLRLIKYPTNRKSALISAGVQVGIIILFVGLVIYDSGASDRAIKKYLEENDIDGAKAYISNHYDASNYNYYEKMADLYEKIDDYDSAAETILDYCGISDLSKLDSDAIDRLMKYKPKVSEDVCEKIEIINTQIVEAKSDREKLEEEAKQAKEEAEKAKADSESAKEEAKQAKEEAEKAKADSESAKEETKQAKEEADSESAKEEAKQAKEATKKAKTENKDDGRTQTASDAEENSKYDTGENIYYEGDPGDMYNDEDSSGIEYAESANILSANELRNFIRQESNIGEVVTFNATVFNVSEDFMFSGTGAYYLRLDDGKTLAYGLGLDNNQVILNEDYVTYTGVFEGFYDANQTGWPYFTTISINLH